MPNHVHLILRREDGEGPALALGKGRPALRQLRQRPRAPDRPSDSGPVQLGAARRGASDEHGRATSRSIPRGRGSLGAPKTGRIRASSAHLAHARRRDRPRQAAQKTARRISPTCSRAKRTPPPSSARGGASRSAGRSVRRAWWRRSSGVSGGRSRRASAAASREAMPPPRINKVKTVASRNSPVIAAEFMSG